jgi:hypothetical protein
MLGNLGVAGYGVVHPLPCAGIHDATQRAGLPGAQPGGESHAPARAPHWRPVAGPASTDVTGIAYRPDPPLYLAVTGTDQVWRSADGATWTRGADLRFPAPIGDLAEASGVSYVMGRFVAIAGLRNPTASAGAIVAAGFLAGGETVGGETAASVDGRAWTYAALAKPAGGGPYILNPQLVAAGGQIVGLAQDPGGGGGAIVTSRDGVHWAYRPLPDARDASPSAVTVTSSGEVIAVGSLSAPSATDCNGDPAAITWTSSDLRTWSPGGPPNACYGLVGVLDGQAGILVFGNGSLGSEAWISPDGRQWTAEPLPASPMWTVGVTSDGTYLASTDPGIVESADGRSWAQSLAVEGLVSFAGRVLIACATSCHAFELSP